MKGDKKKIMVLGLLALVIVCVGAFSFMGGGSTPASADSGKKDEKKDEQVAAKDEDEGPKNPLYAAELPQRDPFQIGHLAGTSPQPDMTTPPAPSLPAPKSTTRKPVRRSSAPDFTVPPVTLGGNLPGAGSPLTLSPAGPDPSAFNYQVSGVIVGKRPAAVFTDSQGNQRLVPVGGSLDGDSKVVSIDKGQVTVEHRGKTLRIPLGGNPK